MENFGPIFQAGPSLGMAAWASHSFSGGAQVIARNVLGSVTWPPTNPGSTVGVGEITPTGSGLGLKCSGLFQLMVVQLTRFLPCGGTCPSRFEI